MAPLTTLSNEVWQTILRYAIYIPDFLDPDSFEGNLRACGFGFVDGSPGLSEDGYWDVERIRGRLQCVCKGWYEYLHRFEHRYVRMQDVQDGQVDKSCLKQAIRISMGQALVTLGQFCSETFGQFDSLPTQILDIDTVLAPQIWNSSPDPLRCFNKVQVVLCPAFYGGIRRPLLSPQTLPAIKHIYGQIYDELHDLHLTSPTLTTVDFRLERRQTDRTLVLGLPSLEHLHVDFMISHVVPELHENILMPLLQSVGAHLRSLYVVTGDTRSKFPREVWEYCPRLEKFRPGMLLVSPPPVSHPIRTLAIAPEYISLGMLLQWPNLQSVIVQQSWSGIGSQQIANITAFWKDVCKDRGVGLEDIRGNSFKSLLAEEHYGKDVGYEETSPRLRIRES